MLLPARAGKAAQAQVFHAGVPAISTSMQQDVYFLLKKPCCSPHTTIQEPPQAGALASFCNKQAQSTTPTWMSWAEGIYLAQGMWQQLWRHTCRSLRSPRASLSWRTAWSRPSVRRRRWRSMLAKPPKDSGLCDALASPTWLREGTCCKDAWETPAGSQAICMTTRLHLAAYGIAASFFSLAMHDRTASGEDLTCLESRNTDYEV